MIRPLDDIVDHPWMEPFFLGAERKNSTLWSKGASKKLLFVMMASFLCVVNWLLFENSIAQLTEKYIQLSVVRSVTHVDDKLCHYDGCKLLIN